MKIELKNVKHGIDRTTDQQHIDASIYIDGVKAGIVVDDGWGGGYRFSPALTPYKLDVGGGKFVEGEESADTEIGDIFNKYLEV